MSIVPERGHIGVSINLTGDTGTMTVPEMYGWPSGRTMPVVVASDSGIAERSLVLTVNGNMTLDFLTVRNSSKLFCTNCHFLHLPTQWILKD